jgi:DNA polymerase III epsilon subunit-like protein
MIYLFFDTETNGLPQSYDLPVTDLTNWPRLISIAWGLYDQTGTQLSEHYAIIKPDGYRWNPVAQRYHRITPQLAAQQGIHLLDALEQLHPALQQADYWVGHNIDLDYGVIGAEYIRAQRINAGWTPSLPLRPRLCTMEASSRVTANHQPVRLDDLYRLLAKRPMKGLHDARADMKATAYCFFELKRRGLY